MPCSGRTAFIQTKQLHDSISYTTLCNVFSLFKVSKGGGDNSNFNKQSQHDGLNETESTTNTYEQMIPSKIVSGDHLYELLPTGKYSCSSRYGTVRKRFIWKKYD